MEFWASVAFLEMDQVVDVARLCDEAGFHGITVSDHVFYPEALASKYPYSATGDPIWDPSTAWPDPWVLIGAMGAVTHRVKFATSIYIAPARNPLLVAKQVATASVLTGGRVVLGVGAGWMREEFELLGQSYENRGKRLDEACEVMRTVWRGGMQEFHGTYHDFGRLEISPAPTAPIPIIAGGHTDAALRRAARLDGWIGNAYTPEDADAHLDRLDAFRREAGSADRDDYQIIIGLLARPSAELHDRFAARGVTGLIHAPWAVGPKADAAAINRMATLDAKREAIERFAEHVLIPLS